MRFIFYTYIHTYIFIYFIPHSMLNVIRMCCFSCSFRFWHALWLKMLLCECKLECIAHGLSVLVVDAFTNLFFVAFCLPLLDRYFCWVRLIWSHICYVQLCLTMYLYVFMHVYLVKCLSSTKCDREQKRRICNFDMASHRNSDTIGWAISKLLLLFSLLNFPK